MQRNKQGKMVWVNEEFNSNQKNNNMNKPMYSKRSKGNRGGEIKLNNGQLQTGESKKKPVPGNAENAWIQCLVVSKEPHVGLKYKK